MRKALAKEPKTRFTTAGELANEFSRLAVSGNNPVPPVKRKMSPPPAPIKRSNPVNYGWILAAALVILALAAGGYWLWALRQAGSAGAARCATVETCERNARVLATADRPLLSIEAYLRAVSLVPSDQQTANAQLPCDLGDAYARINKKPEARIAFKECIAWTHDGVGLTDLRQYAQKRIKELK
jgi:hypothetical protein